MKPIRTGLKSLLLTCAAATTIATGWAAIGSAAAHASPAFAPFGVKVQVNDTLVPFPDAQPFIDSQHLTQVPVRFVTEQLGYQVDWSQQHGQFHVSISNGQQLRIEMTTGDPNVKVNGLDIKLASAPVLQDNRVYVPLRFISETMGIDVEWDADNYIAMLNADGQKHAPAWTKPKMELIDTFTASAYSDHPNENGGFGARDFMGNPLAIGTVAVDPKVIPLGTRLYIEGYDCMGLPAGGMLAVASDTGSAIQGRKVDIFVPGPRQNAIHFGLQSVKVYRMGELMD